MDPVNTLFWNLISEWMNLITPPLRSRVDGESAYFAYRWCHRPISPSLNPRRLITTATTRTTADYMFVLVLQKILSLSGLLRQNILLREKGIIDNLLAIFVFFLCSVSPPTVCLYTACSVSSSQFLVNSKRHLHAWNMNYSVLSRFQWIRWSDKRYRSIHHQIK